MSRQDWQDLRDGMMAALDALDEASGDEGPHKFEQVNAVLKAVDFYAYVVVPRHLLDEVQEAIFDYLNGGSARAKRRMSEARRALINARRAAVVEAVGPTREDQKP